MATQQQIKLIKIQHHNIQKIIVYLLEVKLLKL